MLVTVRMPVSVRVVMRVLMAVIVVGMCMIVSMPIVRMSVMRMRMRSV